MKRENPTELNLSFTPPAIQGFDYAGLKTWAEGIKAKYADVVVMEDQVIGTKSEMAELNRIKKQLDASRIAAVKKVSEPIREFEAQVKEVCGIFQATYDFLGEQVKNYEERAREQKRTEVAFLIEVCTSDAGYPGLDIPIQDAWLAKSKPMKTVKAEIEAIILAHVKAEREAAQLERAKQDRAVAIEQQCAALAQTHGFALPASQFFRLNSLDVPLEEAVESINRAYSMKAEAMARENVAPVTPAAHAAPAKSDAAPYSQHQQPAPGRKSLTVTLEYEAEKEGEVFLALRHLKTLCVTATSMRGGFVQPTTQPQTRLRSY